MNGLKRCKIEEIHKDERIKAVKEGESTIKVEGCPIETPIIFGILCKGEEASSICFTKGIKFWCVYCNSWHHHSSFDGYRVPHCLHGNNSPYHKTGYILKLRDCHPK